MNLAAKLAFGVLSVGLVACGSDGSGVDPDKAIGTLPISDQIKLCELINDHAATAPYVCDGDTREPEDPNDCSEAAVSAGPLPATCEATVGEFEACVEAQAADRCATETPPECVTFFACF